ncbi:MAG: glycosyltransferase [Ignavibacteriaceae bacterium]
MKILFFSYLFPNSNFPSDGIFNFSRAKALKQLGCEVEIIAPVSVNPHMIYLFPKPQIKKQIKLLRKLISVPKAEYYNGIKTYHPKWFKAPNKIFWKYHPNILHFFIGKKINNVINEFNPDLIIATWLNPYAAYSHYHQQNHWKTIFALSEGSDVLVDPAKFNGWSSIEKAINKNCKVVIAVSNKMKKQMQRKTNLQHIEVIRNGFDESIFFYDAKKEYEKSKYLKIITVAKFNQVKGHDILLNSLKYIKIPVKITFVGDGPLLKKYQEFVSNHNLQNIVEFTGEIPHREIPELLKKHDLFCLPSRSEGLPAAPLEAMACGLPVVAANVGGLDEIVIDGFNGYLCIPESPEDIAEKIIAASRIQWNNEEISNWVTDNFSWDTWASHIIDTYEKLVTKEKELLSECT